MNTLYLVWGIILNMIKIFKNKLNNTKIQINRNQHINEIRVSSATRELICVFYFLLLLN